VFLVCISVDLVVNDVFVIYVIAVVKLTTIFLRKHDEQTWDSSISSCRFDCWFVVVMYYIIVLIRRRSLSFKNK